MIPEEVAGFQDALDEIGKWAEVTVFRDKSLVSVVGRGIVSFEGLGDEVHRVAGKLHLAIVSANMLSESFVIDRDKLQFVMDSLHGIIFKTSVK